MSAIRPFRNMSIDDFISRFEGTRCEYHDGHIVETQATSPDHSYLQGAMREYLGQFFNKIGGPRRPGGWWLMTEVAVRYGERFLFSHDLAGWRRSRVAERPRRFPITERPDWVCEILSSNVRDDIVKKKKVLWQQEVPFYWMANPTELIVNVFEWSDKVTSHSVCVGCGTGIQRRDPAL